MTRCSRSLGNKEFDKIAREKEREKCPTSARQNRYPSLFSLGKERRDLGRDAGEKRGMEKSFSFALYRIHQRRFIHLFISSIAPLLCEGAETLSRCVAAQNGLFLATQSLWHYFFVFLHSFCLSSESLEVKLSSMESFCRAIPSLTARFLTSFITKSMRGGRRPELHDDDDNEGNEYENKHDRYQQR